MDDWSLTVLVLLGLCAVTSHGVIDYWSRAGRSRGPGSEWATSTRARSRGDIPEVKEPGHTDPTQLTPNSRRLPGKSGGGHKQHHRDHRRQHRVDNKRRFLRDYIFTHRNERNDLSHGKLQLNPYFSVNWDLRFLGDGGDWWKGSNVCCHEEEWTEDITPEEGEIRRHIMTSASSCDDTGTVYKCTTEITINSTKETKVILCECCHGFRREPKEQGCTVEVPMETLLETMEDVGATEMVESIIGVSLDTLLQQANYTVFAPTDGFLERFKQPEGPWDPVVQLCQLDQLFAYNDDFMMTFQPIEETPGVLIVTPDLVDLAREFEETVGGHIVEGFVKTGRLEDEQLLSTLSAGDKIRVNLYNTPKQLMTANCRPIISSDNLAVNGVVHVTEGPLPLVRDSLAALLGKTEDLTMFKTLIGQSGLLSMLKKPGQLTLLAPSNTAFSRLNPHVRAKLMNGDMCFTEILKNHLLPNVICSSVLASWEGSLHTINLLNEYLNVTRQDGKLFVHGAQLLDTDLMATNGVLHIIDDILIPKDALTFPEVVKELDFSIMLDLIQQADLMDELVLMSNYTAFVPSDEAFRQMPQAHLAALRDDPVRLREFLYQHLLEGVLEEEDLTGTAHLLTVNGRTLQVASDTNRFFHFWKPEIRVQCSTVKTTDIGTCGGVIHTIDKVLVTPQGHLLDLLAEKDDFSSVSRLLSGTDLVKQLSDEKESFTFFAPTNKAMESLDPDDLQYLEDNPDKLKDFLRNHIMNDIQCCSGISTNMETALEGSALWTSRFRDQALVNRIPITECDHMATNGILHAIDEVMPSARRNYITRGRNSEAGEGFVHSMSSMEEHVRKLMDHLFTRKPKHTGVDVLGTEMEFEPHGSILTPREIFGRKHHGAGIRGHGHITGKHHHRRPGRLERKQAPNSWSFQPFGSRDKRHD